MTSMKNINSNQKEVRLKDECGHFLGMIRDGRLFIFCKRCKKFHEVTLGEDEKIH
jgi:hypothetical protein